MTNSNNTEARARSIPKNGRALYEFGTLEDGTVVIKSVIVPREEQLVVAKAKDGTVAKARVAD